MENTYEIRVLSRAEIVRATEWAAAEGWNPGRSDAGCFASVDTDGFWGGFLNGEMIACISVVNYGADFAFLGFYIVAPAHRGQGYGFVLWNRAMDHAGTRVIGLDGVVDQQANYRKSGFDLAWNNIRFGGVPRRSRLKVAADLQIGDVTAPSEALEEMDRSVFPAPRGGFWRAWLGAPGHVCIDVKRAGQLAGFGTVRPCETGWKLGPLTSSDRSVAEAILARLLQAVPDGDTVFLDVPEPHGAAVALARELGLEPVFETARMYRGPAPDLAVEQIFGVTTFELG